MTTTLRKHERLMGRMADRLGVDLDEAELRGDLAPELRTEMLQRCTGCSDPADCARHLETGGHDAPGYCRNADRLRDLGP